MRYRYSGRFSRRLNSLRAQTAKLHCPRCYGNKITVDITQQYHCEECYSTFDFQKLLTVVQLRDKKIDSIL